MSPESQNPESKAGRIFVAGLFVVLTISLLLVIFVVNPAQEGNRNEIAKQQKTLHSVICAQAQSTANAYRVRSLTPSGQPEPIRHFLTRLQAQQQTLRLSRGLGCKSSPGFPPFGHQIQRALTQIADILSRFSSAMKEPVTRRIFPSASAPSPLNILGDEGVLMPLLPDLGSIDSGSATESPKPPSPDHPSSPPTPPPAPPQVEAPPAPPTPAPEVVEPEEPERSPIGQTVEPPLCTVIREIHLLC